MITSYLTLVDLKCYTVWAWRVAVFTGEGINYIDCIVASLEEWGGRGFYFREILLPTRSVTVNNIVC